MTAPEMVKGTVCEIFSRGGKPLDRMVYFPALDRVRDLSGIRRTDSFHSRVERVAGAKTYLPIRTLYYDLAGRLFKRATFDAVQSIDGHSMPTRVSMEDVQSGEKSEFRLHDIHLNAPIDEKLFSESPIQKRRAKH